MHDVRRHTKHHAANAHIMPLIRSICVHHAHRTHVCSTGGADPHTLTMSPPSRNHSITRNDTSWMRIVVV